MCVWGCERVLFVGGNGDMGRDAVCGSLDAVLTVRDNGDGTCTAGLQQGTTFTRTNCSSPIFSQIRCDTLLAALTLVFRRVNPNVPYRQSMQTWLNQLGFGVVSVLARPLVVYVDHSPLPVPQPLAPAFFSSLAQVIAGQFIILLVC